MSKKRKLYPVDYIESTYQIDFEQLYSEGYRGVIFDIDNTLVPHNAPADDRAVTLFEHLHELGYSACLVSNNKEPRVKSFKEKVIYCDYVFLARKPSSKGYEKAMRIMNTNVENTLFVGDQILTDVWGANNAGIRSIMVKPVLKWHEEIQIILKRVLEAFILLGYRVYKIYGKEVITTPLKKGD